MNICFVAHLGDLSGANKSLIDLVCAIRKQGVNVFVIVPKKGELSGKLDELNIQNKCIFSGSWLGNRNKEKNIKKVIKIIVNIFAEYRFYKFFKKNRTTFNVVHYNSFIYGVGSKSLIRLNIPFVWHIREFPEETFNLTFYNKRKAYSLVSNSKKVFAISNAIYKRFMPDFGKDKMHLIYNGLNIDSFVMKNRKIYSDNKLSILIVGAIAEDKGQYEAIKAIAYLVQKKGITNLILNIVGSIVDDNYFKEMNLYIEKEGLNNYVLFHGYFSDLSSFRSDCDIALICSKMEAFGRVTIEAMLSKELVIGANTGGTVEIISDMESGLLYKQGDFISLANKLEYAMSHKNEVEKMIENAYEIAKNQFSIERTAREVIEEYKTLRR